MAANLQKAGIKPAVPKLKLNLPLDTYLTMLLTHFVV